MARLRRGRWRWAAGVGALALLLSLAALPALREPAAAQTSLAEARGRWASQPAAGYRLKLTRTTASKGDSQICQQEIEVLDEQVAREVSNGCGQPATWTVTRLFNWVAELEREPSRCYPSASTCACQATTTTRVVYDTVLGFPSEVIYEWRSRPNLMNPAYWRILLDKTFPGCSNIQGSGSGGVLAIKVSLAPEP
ncbi:MAG: hypothetical protein HGA45_17955 [Chloroflexales bacterium]|nr:hypothetical protein [Chloroflexales bacterium]